MTRVAMAPRTRALIGASTGAVLVLIAHPSTRPAMLAAFRPASPDRLAALLARPPLQRPTDRLSGAATLHAGAERLLDGPTLSAEERASLVRVAEAGGRTEADNAFWPLARFVFRDGRGGPARDDWRLASGRSRYDDYQSQFLLESVGRVARRVGIGTNARNAPAWVYAAMTMQRSQAMGLALQRLAFRSLENLGDPQAHDLFAVQAIHNGASLRDGSGQFRLAACGMAMIEAATYPIGKPVSDSASPQEPLGGGPKRNWIRKTQLTAKLRTEGKIPEARYCDEQFRINDSFRAVEDVENPEGRFRTLAIAAVIVGALPGALLVASLAGGLVWLFGLRVASVAFRQSRFRGPGLSACSLALLTSGAFLGSPWVGLTAGLCALVPALGPERPKRYGDVALGPLHATIVLVTGIALLFGVAVVAIAGSLPGAVLPELGPVGAWLGDAQRLGAAIIALLGASALVAPAYAVVRRYSTPVMATQTYVPLGRGVALGGFALAIVASPLCFALDRFLGDGLGRIALNEPTAYGSTGVGKE